MGGSQGRALAFLASVPAFQRLSGDALERVADALEHIDQAEAGVVYRVGEVLRGVYLIESGEVEVSGPEGGLVSRLSAGDVFGERGLLRDGRAVTTARTQGPARLWCLPAAVFRATLDASPAFREAFARGEAVVARPAAGDLSTVRVADLMAREPVACGSRDTVAAVAAAMRREQVSSLAVVEDGRLLGIVTTRDLVGRVLAGGGDASGPVTAVMTADPRTVAPSDLGTDLLHAMLEHGIGHLPVVEDGRLVGMVTQTDLTRFQASSAAQLVRDAARAGDVATLAAVTARLPRLLMRLVEADTRHDTVTRLLTDVADTVTRRLVALALRELGPAPVAWVWAACGSQGRQEQAGVSDQDNALIVDDAVDEAGLAWFNRFARQVCDGLDACGYVHCPGEMMAMNPRWCQPLRVWRDYFHGWIRTPDPMARMLSSVMFDLRAVAGDAGLLERLRADTLAAAGRNTIFVAHMITNSLTHEPPLTWLRGLATVRRGEHRDHVDLKLGGVIPIVDLGRLYALQGGIAAVGTRRRLQLAGEAGITSTRGARDLVDAFDLIAGIRLRHQARLVRAGRRPDNFLDPTALSDLERGHLRDAFVVVRTMQNALGHGRSAPS